MVYRPVRERHPEVLKALARKLVDNTGYNEISLVSLSTADYTCLAPMIHDMIAEFKDERVSVSLPSLRIDSFSVDLAKEVQAVRKSGLTFAPEAGSQRMRDVINKGVTEEDLMNAVSAAFKSGWSSVKLYFMIGLPGETDEDVLAIADLAKKVQYKYREITGKGGCKVTVSASSFVPKPYTPFQWSAQNSMDELRRKQYLLKDALKVKILLSSITTRKPALWKPFLRAATDALARRYILHGSAEQNLTVGANSLIMNAGLKPCRTAGLIKNFTLPASAAKTKYFRGNIFSLRYRAPFCAMNIKSTARRTDARLPPRQLHRLRCLPKTWRTS